MKAYFILLTILSLCSFNISYGRQSYAEIKILTDEIDKVRRGQINTDTKKTIDEINTILSGQKYGISHKQTADAHERKTAWEAILSEHLADRNLTIPTNIYEPLKLIDERYVGHAAALFTMHMAAYIFTHQPGSYFAPDQYLAEQILRPTLFKQVTGRTHLHLYFCGIKDFNSYLKGVLGASFMKSVINLTRNYPDVSHQWLINAYKSKNRPSSDQMITEPYSEQWPYKIKMYHEADKSYKTESLILPTPEPIFKELKAVRPLLQNQDWFAIGNHWVIIRNQPQYKESLKKLNARKYLNALEEALMKRGWNISRWLEPNPELFSMKIRLEAFIEESPLIIEESVLSVYEKIHFFAPGVHPFKR